MLRFDEVDLERLITSPQEIDPSRKLYVVDPSLIEKRQAPIIAAIGEFTLYKINIFNRSEIELPTVFKDLPPPHYKANLQLLPSTFEGMQRNEQVIIPLEADRIRIWPDERKNHPRAIANKAAPAMLPPNSLYFMAHNCN